MNQAGNSYLAIKQDTTTTNAESISVELKTGSQPNVESRKAVQAIPEVPARFQNKQKKVLHSKQKFIPTASDSIAFNLKTRVQDKEGILNNTVVEDYLEPISRSDKTWLQGSVEAIIEVVDDMDLDVDTIVQDSVKVEAINLPKADLEKYPSQVDSLYGAGDAVVHAEDKITTTVEAPQQTNKEAIGTSIYAKDILTGLIILSVAVVGVIRVTNFKYLRELFSAFIFSQYARKMMKEENMRNQMASFMLNGLFLFNAAIFLFEFIHYRHIDTALVNNLLLIPIGMGIIFAFGLVKGVLYRFTGYVFDCSGQTSEYTFYSRLHDKIFGLVILPIILVVPYIDKSALSILFYLGIGVYALLYLIQLFRV